jgi:hypothetical protein
MFVRSLLSVLTVLALAASCGSAAENSSAPATTPPESVEQTTTIAAPATDSTAHLETTMAPDPVDADVEPPRAGSKADLENPIGILEDGSTFDPQWRADVTLACGPDSDTRTIAVFDANTNDRGAPALYQQQPSGGGFALQPATVGSMVPVDVDLAWSIPGILLGPWRVDSITDGCVEE